MPPEVMRRLDLILIFWPHSGSLVRASTVPDRPGWFARLASKPADEQTGQSRHMLAIFDSLSDSSMSLRGDEQ